MLKYSLLHPEILYTLARNGHGAKVLITDGNFPVETNSNNNATKVYLNLAPDLCSVTDVFKVLQESIPIEKIITMKTDESVAAPVTDEIRALAESTVEILPLAKGEFYEHSSSSLTCLTIVTGETRRFANIILVIGVHRKSKTQFPINMFQSTNSTS